MLRLLFILHEGVASPTCVYTMARSRKITSFLLPLAKNANADDEREVVPIPSKRSKHRETFDSSWHGESPLDLLRTRRPQRTVHVLRVMPEAQHVH